MENEKSSNNGIFEDISLSEFIIREISEQKNNIPKNVLCGKLC